MKKSNIYLLLFIICSFVSVSVNAQETEKTDTVMRVLEQLQSDVAFLKNLKVSGYVQAQAQFADTLGAKTDMAAGNFPTGSDKRYLIRRGRLKFLYSASPLSSAAMQIDISESGVKTKEIWAKFTDPFVNWFSLTAGLQNRPFGFEVEYSSGNLESPERARMNQSLFKDEYDLGAMLTIQAPKTSPYNFLKLDLGLFTGSIENTSGMDYKKVKDFIGRLNFAKSYLDEKLKVSGDLSYYNGGVPNNTTSIYKVQTASGNPVFTAKTVNKYDNILREYWGADVQVSYAGELGLSTFRAEYTKGQQASAAGDIKNPTALLVNSATPAVAQPLYVRQVEGFYLMYVQNILQSRHSIVVKYDMFDPNTKVSGNQISSANGFTASDIKFNTWGLGYTCRIDANTKLVIYRDFIKNESTKISGYTQDVKDNVWTIRLQYKF
ncbi:MAG: hypothetical protein Q8928_02810 [Bacteroidota bacterium]|nr:hypothetical protein [Bacteroidota bacterium]